MLAQRERIQGIRLVVPGPAIQPPLGPGDIEGDAKRSELSVRRGEGWVIPAAEGDGLRSRSDISGGLKELDGMFTQRERIQGIRLVVPGTAIQPPLGPGDIEFDAKRG